MSSHLNVIQTGCAIARCSLAYGEAYLPHFGHYVSKIARQTLFAFDVIETGYVAHQIRKKLYEREYPRDTLRFHIDLAVKGVALLALAALFVKGVNKVMIPKLNPLELLQSTKIPREVLELNAEGSLSHLTAKWTKLPLENLVTGLLFTRTILDLYLAYLTSARRPLFNALVHAGTLFKTSHYATLEISHTFSFLLQRINYMCNRTQSFSELNKKFFNVPVQKIEANFYLNIGGLSKQELIDKTQEIYVYSVGMFNNSFWARYWTHGRTHSEYLLNVVHPQDEGFKAYIDFFNIYSHLKYAISIKGTPPPVPVEVRVFHQDNIWQSFKGIDVLQWIPRFWIPAQTVPYSEWIDAELNLPPSPMDNHVAKITTILNAFLRS